MRTLEVGVDVREISISEENSDFIIKGYRNIERCKKGARTEEYIR
jgi:hypothetical protein